MSFETECDIKLTKGGELIIDEHHAILLEKISRTGSLELATEELGILVDEAKTWLDRIGDVLMTPAVLLGSDGKMTLTDKGRELLSDYQTRSRMAKSQVQNLWKKPWVTADGIVVIEGQVVLIKKGREPFKGMYALPGGIVEYGETAEECAVREFEEETGLRTRVLDLVGVYSAADRDPRGHFITLAFNLQPIGGLLYGGDDAAEALLFPLDRLPDMAADHKKILADALIKRDQYR
jgi:8-oxo-dGTP diphosphatase